MRNYTEKQVLKAVQGSTGLIQCVADRLACSWSTARKYIGQYKSCVEQFDSELQGMLDKAESAIHEAIQEKDLQVCKWYLANKGKQRGYGETPVDLLAAEKKDRVELQNLTSEEQDQLVNLLAKIEA
jgi:hypothetical protein